MEKEARKQYEQDWKKAKELRRCAGFAFLSGLFYNGHYWHHGVAQHNKHGAHQTKRNH